MSSPKLSPDLFEVVGREYLKFVWTDQELREHLAVMECVLRYLSGRSDCGIVLYKLRQENDVLLSFQREREIRRESDRIMIENQRFVHDRTKGNRTL